MVSTIDLETFAVVDAAGDVENHGVVEKVGAGEAKAVVAVGLGEMGIEMLLEAMQHLRLNQVGETRVLCSAQYSRR